MSVAHDTSKLSVRDQVSDEEWQMRVDLAALYRLVAHYGWTDLIFTHLSARVPGPEHHFLINPYGMLFDEITASSLVKVDTAGEIVMESPYPVNPAGFTIHSAIHMAREDAKCVMHLHTDDGVAVSAQADGLLPITQTAMNVISQVTYHDYEGIALDLGERDRLVADLGDKFLMILRNHGTLSVGVDCPSAFTALFFLERACTMQIKALSGGVKLNWPNEGVAEHVANQAKGMFSGGFGKLGWPSLLRMLDREDASYRD
jgi:ribulose-5-phosphate 4-epimerase/fuculose-1-phosphate aldolase